jgi:hypothetical protein
MTSPAPDILLAWHDAVNAGDVEAAVARCSEDVAVLGPRGVGHGHDLVRGWLQRSGIRLEPQDGMEEREGRFVVRETARWTRPGPSGVPAEPTDTWCVFTVADGHLTSIARYETPEQVPPA